MKLAIFILALLNTLIVYSQNDKIIFKEYKKGFYENEILKDASQIEKSSIKVRKYPYVETNSDYPTDTSLYLKFWHNAPLSQGITGTCWSFGAISFIESEIYRTTNQKVKLSEMYIVYWEYVERAIDFVETRGETYISEGSESNAIKRIIKKYGIVTTNYYSGNLNNKPYHDHRLLFDELDSYLKSVKENNLWNEAVVVESVKSILNKHIGNPPSKVLYNNKEISTKDYAIDILKININDYFSFMSTLEVPFNEKHELVEADNWWKDDNYYNLSLNDYLEMILSAIKNGFTNCICGDVSEIGNIREQGVSIIPSFDIETKSINNEARTFRLLNSSTTDDHCMHIVGYYLLNNENWFLLKDSGAGGFDSPVKGYRFVHEDYIKLKMMNVLISGRAAKKYLDKIIK